MRRPSPTSAAESAPQGARGPSAIALFIPLDTGGGAERVMVNLGIALGRTGQPVDFVVVRDTGPFIDELRGARNLRYRPLHAVSTMRSIPHLTRYLWRERPVAVISALNTPNIASILATAFVNGFRGTRPRIRCIVTVHNTWRFKGAGLRAWRAHALRWATRLLFPLAHHVVAVSRGIASDLPPLLGTDPARISVLYNPVVDERLLAAARQPAGHPWLGAEDEVPVFLAVGRLAPMKGFDVLLQAFAAVRGRRACRLIILGEGPEREALTATALRLGVRDDVDLPGFAVNPYAFMARASAFVLSSRAEALPTVLIEALALGVPIASTDCDFGPREILQNGTLGKLVAVDDPLALAQAMQDALTVPHDPVAGWAHALPFTIDLASRAYLQLAIDGTAAAAATDHRADRIGPTPGTP